MLLQRANCIEDNEINIKDILKQISFFSYCGNNAGAGHFFHTLVIVLSYLYD